MPVNIGHIFATIGLNTAQLTAGATQAQATLTKLDTSMANISKRLTQVGVFAAVAGTALITGLVKSGMDAISAQMDLANSLDVSIDGLRGLQLAAKEAGVESETLHRSIAMMNARLGEAQRGTGNAKEALDRLQLSAKVLAEMDIDERMATIADRVRELGLSSSQTADVLRQFGIRGGEMVELFRQGGDAIRAARADVDAFGISLSAIDAKMVDNAQESIQRMGLTLEGVRNKVTIALAPILGVLADKFNEASKASGGFGDIAVDAVMKVGQVLAFVGNAVRGLHIAFKGVELGVVALGAVFNKFGGTAVEVFLNIRNYAIDRINEIIRALQFIGVKINELKKVDTSQALAGFHERGEAAVNVIETILNDMDALAQKDLPTEAWDKFVEDVRKKQAELAAMQVEGREGGGDGTDFESEETNKKREALKQQLDAVREYGMDEYELLNKQLQDKMELIRQAVAERVLLEEEGRELVADVAKRFVEEEQNIEKEKLARLEAENAAKREAAIQAYETEREFALSDEEAEIEEYERKIERIMNFIKENEELEAEGHKRIEELTQQHMDRLAEIRMRGMDDVQRFAEAIRQKDVKGANNALIAMTEGLSRHSKTMFEINKGAAISKAIVDAFTSINRTWAEWGYPWGIPMAAAQAALAFANVRAISSQSFGKGGGVAPSVSTSTPAPPVSPVGGQGSGNGGTLLTIEGLSSDQLFSGRAVRELMERIAEHQRDGGGRIQFAGA
jgi:hypothetical protein